LFPAVSPAAAPLLAATLCVFFLVGIAVVSFSFEDPIVKNKTKSHAA
jgi:hypothetical protein